MIILKSRAEIERMRKANQLVFDVMERLTGEIKEGVTSGELDQIAEDMIRSAGAEPAFKGYRGYKHTLCTSFNEEVVHGIPGKRKLTKGDILGIDCGVLLDGFYGDMARTFPVGEVSATARKLLKVTEESLYAGIEQMRVGNRLYDISAAIQGHVEKNGFTVVRDFVGHGIGTSLHEDPQIPNYGPAGSGVKLKAGMVFAIEPMVNVGTWQVKMLDDGWTVITADRELSSHFEHTIAITENGPDILSKR